MVALRWFSLPTTFDWDVERLISPGNASIARLKIPRLIVRRKNLTPTGNTISWIIALALNEWPLESGHWGSYSSSSSLRGWTLDNPFCFVSDCRLKRMPWLLTKDDGVIIVENGHPKATEQLFDRIRSSKSSRASFSLRQFAQDLLRPEDFFHVLRPLVPMILVPSLFFSSLWKTAKSSLASASCLLLGRVFWCGPDCFTAAPLRIRMTGSVNAYDATSLFPFWVGFVFSVVLVFELAFVFGVLFVPGVVFVLRVGFALWAISPNSSCSSFRSGFRQRILFDPANKAWLPKIIYEPNCLIKWWTSGKHGEHTYLKLHHWPRIPLSSGHTKPLWPGITTLRRVYRV